MLHFVELCIAEWLICILPLSQLVCQFPFIQTVNQTTLPIVILTVFWQHCPGSYGEKKSIKIMQTTVFTLKSKINQVIDDSEGMFHIYYM